MKENLNVRQLESLVQRINEDVSRETSKVKIKIFLLKKKNHNCVNISEQLFRLKNQKTKEN